MIELTFSGQIGNVEDISYWFNYIIGLIQKTAIERKMKYPFNFEIVLKDSSDEFKAKEKTIEE